MGGNPSFLDSKSYALKMETLFKDLIRNYIPKTLISNLNLSKINYLIFPDWQTDEEELTAELYNLISTLAKNSPISNSPLITGNPPVSDSPLIKGGWGGSNLVDSIPSTSLRERKSEVITLVMDTTGITEEDANLFLSGIAMNLMMEEELDLENTLDFALINNLNEQQYTLNSLFIHSPKRRSPL